MGGDERLQAARREGRRLGHGAGRHDRRAADLVRQPLARVHAAVARADSDPSLPTQWEMQSFIHSNGEVSEFVQVFSLYSRRLVEGSPVVDLVFCSISDQMKLEKVTITTTSTMDETGHWNVTHEVAYARSLGR